MESTMIIPEIVPEVKQLKEILAKELPECKISIPLLNRKCLCVARSFGITTEVFIRPNKIAVQNTSHVKMALAFLFFLPYGIYLMFKTKDGVALRSRVHDIVFRATRNQ